MKEFLSRRFVRTVLAMTGLLATVGGPIPTTPPKLEAFKSNGCSVFPDGDTFGCCYVHDMSYWAGGTAVDRRRADRGLEQCVADVTGNRAVSGLMYAAVTIFGTPGVPTRVEWGYGWGDSRQVSYTALTRAEQDQVDAHKQAACQTFTHNTATGRFMIDQTHWLRAVDREQMCEK